MMTIEDPSYHYAVIARALTEIEKANDPLSLADLAQRMNMSPAHFQRIFSAWVGVSPKRYHQYLALDFAKDLLRQRMTVLETSNELGLSGGGRLHDLFLTWEAMTPGQYALGGQDMVLTWGIVPSPFGEAIIVVSDRGICGMGFCEEQGRDWTLADLARRWPKARLLRSDTAVGPVAEAAFGGRGNLHLMGAPFQIKVWEALLRIPSGHVTTYSAIASAIGHDRAVRAVGTAVGRNPVSMLIPCHRALRKGGALGGYHWGLTLKRAILAHESARLEAAE